MYNIGGIYLAEVKEGTAGEKHKPVVREKQQMSLQWVINEYKNAIWLDNGSLKKYFPVNITGSSRIRSALLSNIKGLFHNIILSSYYTNGTPYSINDFSSDLYKATWGTLLQGKMLTEGDMALQKEIVKILCNAFGKNGIPVGYETSVGSESGFDDAPSEVDVEAYSIGKNDCGFSVRGGDGDMQINFDYGSEISFGKTFGKTNPYLSKVDIQAIDQTNAYLQDMAIRSRDLLKSRLATSSAKDKIHYQSLLIQLNSAMRDKM
jgi:hypothetical protein